MHRFNIRSTERQQLIDITAEVAAATRQWTCDALLVFSLHTTAGILINEHADPDVAHDIVVALDHIVPTDGMYRHGEGNSPAHIKSSLVGTSQVVALNEGRLVLGTWQGIFLAEFDGPRNRTVVIAPISSALDARS